MKKRKGNSGRRKIKVAPEKKRENWLELKGKRKHRIGGQNGNGEEGRKRKAFKGFLKTETQENQMPHRRMCPCPTNPNVTHGHGACSAIMLP